MDNLKKIYFNNIINNIFLIAPISQTQDRRQPGRKSFQYIRDNDRVHDLGGREVGYVLNGQTYKTGQFGNSKTRTQSEKNIYNLNFSSEWGSVTFIFPAKPYSREELIELSVDANRFLHSLTKHN